MAIVEKKPPIKETVGAQFVCFSVMSDGDWTDKFEEEVEKTETVKSVKVTENSEGTDIYASGKVYDTDYNQASTDVEVEVIAFPAATRAKMRGETVNEGGLVLSGGNGVRPYFAYGKVVKLKKNEVRFEWFPKCKLASNSDEVKTREASFSEQTDTMTIKAYPFDDAGNCKTYVETSIKFPDGLTEEKFFSKPILTQEDLTAVLSAAQTTE